MSFKENFNLASDFDFSSYPRSVVYAEIEKKIPYPDHYKYSQDEIKKLISIAEMNNLEIITTEKDYYRLKKFDIKKINFLPVNLLIENKENFTKNIIKFIK